MKRLSIYVVSIIVSSLIIISGCGKNDAPPTNPTTNPSPNPSPPVTPKNCIIAGVSQQNTGAKSDFAITVTYNNDNPTRIIVFDSLANTKVFEANLSYVTADSIRIDSYQYIKLDASKRVSVFVTKSDMSIPASADDYKYVYSYNTDGYLSTKKLYINGSATPFQNTVYTYTNNLLSKCIMTVANNTSLKVLESDITYDNNITLKNWIYTFPDAFESNIYNTVLNFGNKANKAISKIETKIFNPSNGNILDTWTTNYNTYTLNTDGYLQSATAAGDLQQGIASFYGKTAFYYLCK